MAFRVPSAFSLPPVCGAVATLVLEAAIADFFEASAEFDCVLPEFFYINAHGNLLFVSIERKSESSPVFLLATLILADSK